MLEQVETKWEGRGQENAGRAWRASEQKTQNNMLSKLKLKKKNKYNLAQKQKEYSMPSYKKETGFTLRKGKQKPSSTFKQKLKSQTG